MVNLNTINVVILVSKNGLCPTILSGVIIERLLKLKDNKFKFIFKTDCNFRHSFIFNNYSREVIFDPNYIIKSTDFVIHIINPREIPSGGYDVFIDILGDYWNYIYNHKLYSERLKLYLDGIKYSKNQFLTSLISKGFKGIKFKHYCIVDNAIRKNNVQSFSYTEDRLPLFLGSFKTKNINFDISFAKKCNIVSKQYLLRSELVKNIVNASTILLHPGMNSIFESIFLNKPFIFVGPANTEQKYNSWIISHYNLGCVLKLNNLDAFNKNRRIFNKNYSLYIYSIKNFIKKYNISTDISILDNFLQGAINDFERNFKF